MEAELLAAITAAPDDDAPRMVYADWLMQRGDLRGEFIALQCRIARADAADEAIDAGVLARERELREGLAETWTAPLRAIVDADYVFRRGFVEHVGVWMPRDITYRATPGVFDPQPPPAVDVTDRLGGLVAAAPLLRSIAIPADVLDHVLTPVWSELTSVTLTERGGYDESIRAFLSQARSLRRLHLVNADVDEVVAASWLAADRPLEHLGFHIGWNTTRAVKLDVAELIAGNRALHGLRSLYLGGIPTLDQRQLTCLAKLERLALHRCRLTQEQVCELLRALPALEMLELDDDDRGLGKPDVLALLAASPRLRRLSLRNWRLGNEGGIALASSPHAASLRRLELDQCSIGDRAAKAMLASAHLAGVTWLRVSEEGKIATETRAGLEARHRLHYEPPKPRYPEPIASVLPGQKILAIKEHRARSSVGLADSKMAVERIAEELGMGPAPNPGGPPVPQHLRATTRWCNA